MESITAHITDLRKAYFGAYNLSIRSFAAKAKITRHRFNDILDGESTATAKEMVAIDETMKACSPGIIRRLEQKQKKTAEVEPQIDPEQMKRLEQRAKEARAAQALQKDVMVEAL